MIAFILKKVVTYVLLPPGCFIILVLLSAFLVKRWFRLVAVFLAALLYLSAITPVHDLLVIPLEDAYGLPSAAEVRKGNAYVVLGGGVYDFAPDIDGRGALSGEALSRLVCAYRLYRMDRKPIIFSGGQVFEGQPEAKVAKRMLLSFGVNEKDIIVEAASKDTHENAKLVKEIAERLKITRIVLITSAFHMKRSMMLFDKVFKGTIPYPTGYHTSRGKYNILSYLPDTGNLAGLALALKEYMGILFYNFTL
jgi:uncharacterized SAM-binding protein YcdF (DUF218 family)